MKTIYNKKYLLWTTAILLLSVTACKKALEVSPPQTRVTLDKIFSDSSLLIQATLNVYRTFGLSENYTIPNSGYVDDLNTTTVSSSSGTTTDIFNNQVQSDNSTTTGYWKNMYTVIYNANAILENIGSATDINIGILSRVEGECRFLRAYCYFHLVNAFGDVPLLLTSDVNTTSVASRSPAAKVYEQIITDLTTAKNLLLDVYAGEERVRATKYAAAALLARVYLYNKQYDKAEAEATSVLNSGLFTPLPATANVFLKTSKEAILLFWNANGFASNYSGLIPTTAKPTYYLTNALYNSFENGDQRKSNWTVVKTVTGVNYNCFYKYKQTAANTGATAEYASILRGSEQYMIRSEARAMQNNLSGAIADLNVIRVRAAITSLPVTLTQPQIIAAIMQESKVEFFAENSHRFFDLKRWGIVDQVIKPQKTNWQSFNQYYPIPRTEINLDPNLVQNPGY
jgi:hypothetical protein